MIMNRIVLAAFAAAAAACSAPALADGAVAQAVPAPLVVPAESATLGFVDAAAWADLTNRVQVLWAEREAREKRIAELRERRQKAEQEKANRPYRVKRVAPAAPRRPARSGGSK